MNLKTFHLCAIQEQTTVMEVRKWLQRWAEAGSIEELSSLREKFCLALLMVSWCI